MRSVMSHSFGRVPQANIPRSSFDRSSGVKTAFDAGYLIPFFCDEVLPGDTFNLRTSGFARLATPLYPIMDNMFMDTFYFFVPNRLVWDNWQKMMGEQDNPGDSTDYITPVTGSGIGWTTGSLADYFGLPTQVGNDQTANALPFRAYNLIWNEWFRDQNLQDSLEVHKGDGPDPQSDYTIQRRGKRHDYFTSCLPWPQKGPDVDLPIGTTAPVYGAGQPIGETGNYWLQGKVFGQAGLADVGLRGEGASPIPDATTIETASLEEFTTLPFGLNAYADLTSATAATINQLRQAFQIQKMYERDARGGTRYTEIVRSHFGVVSPDARLQRPEYLGGGSQRINITAVQSNTDSADLSDGTARNLGDLAATGTTAFNGHGFTKSFTEHGFIIGLVNVRADLTYQQGENRMWNRKDRFDYYFPALAHLGEQAVLNREIYLADNEEENNKVFGYQERFAEYRYKPSLITGKMRSTAAGTLDAWHLSQQFNGAPTLSADFIQDEPPIDRIIAVPSEPHFIADFHHRLRCARPMPLYGTPGNVDRF